MIMYLHTPCNPVVFEVQFLSEAHINSGVNVTFPIKYMIIPVESEVPNPTLSMRIVKLFTQICNFILNSL